MLQKCMVRCAKERDCFTASIVRICFCDVRLYLHDFWYFSALSVEKCAKVRGKRLRKNKSRKIPYVSPPPPPPRLLARHPFISPWAYRTCKSDSEESDSDSTSTTECNNRDDSEKGSN